MPFDIVRQPFDGGVAPLRLFSQGFLHDAVQIPAEAAGARAVGRHGDARTLGGS